ncbi:saccharopine dehydrogenase NADP-binding domain-containing protein [Chroococcidiopsis sp. CCMEE 29]|uniref:saccharopine dehydrogenase NADP-binding domain-containing protein n=1 Tax=Chroococcidiopsis sp. CCMEE 29 TaxID=155894 RepID=UPI0020204603|nr:saccharopine dehydrogenase NADP-binding domain-containing protein [Chroococcidiopsis sp. CCMEE 29]
MLASKIYTSFKGRLFLLGFGCIGQAILPLILRHIALSLEQITIISAREEERETAESYGINFIHYALTPENCRSFWKNFLSQGDFLVNVSADIASVDLIEVCLECNVLYLDTSNEPWLGGCTDPNVTLAERSCYA